jgi:hypothetical protein
VARIEPRAPCAARHPKPDQTVGGVAFEAFPRCVFVAAKAAAALGAALFAACIWSAPPNVRVEGSVHLTVCAGTEPMNPPPGWSSCRTQVVSGATVLLAPTWGAVITVCSDSGGRYRFEVSPGIYILAASSNSPRFFSDPRWIRIVPGPTLEIDVGSAISLA